MFYESTGTIRYDPKTRTGGEGKPWWMIIDGCEGLRRYYAWWVMKEQFDLVQAPIWGAHISVIRGEMPSKPRNWGLWDGGQMTFRYEDSPQTDGYYWWLPVECESILDLREHLALPRNPRFKLHFTLGQVTHRNW
jgi:hypothetical protein